MITTKVFTRRVLVVLLIALLVVSGCGITRQGDSVYPPTEEDDAGDSADASSIDTTQTDFEDEDDLEVDDLSVDEDFSDNSGRTNRISAGTAYSMALMADGTIWTWGKNSNGQLGDGTKESKPIPVQVIAPEGVGALKNVVALSAGAHHSLALLADGTVWAWGDNSHGQLGVSSTPFSYTPVQVGNVEGDYLTDVTAISAGHQFSLALQSDGTVWAWGQNEFGQLGDNTKTGREVPAQVLDSAGEGVLSGIIEVSAGHSHCLALEGDGSIWAWGNNIYYQLGDGTGAYRKLPVQVRGPAGVGYLNLFDPPGQ